MTEEMTALARRVVACKGWRWMGGMRALPCSPHDSGLRGIPVRVVHVYDGDGLVVWGAVPGAHSGSWEEWRWREEGRLPDLTDPATLGCLLALVREAWGSSSAYVMPWGVSLQDKMPAGWSMMPTADNTLPTAKLSAPTEAEALVAALEAAP